MAGRVVVAEMDDEQRKRTSLWIEQTAEMSVVGAAHDGEEALEMVIRLQPDVLVCGMMMPRLDGCGLLEQLRELPQRPAVIVISNVRQDDFIRRAFDLGASDYLIKPYDPHTLIRRLESIVCEHAGYPQTRQTEQRLSGMLLKLGIPAHVKGYRFLQDAVLAVMVDPGVMKHMMHDLYPRVAIKYHTSAECVERSIRHAICMAWERCRPEESSRILGRSVIAGYERPTSSELIALVAEKMRLYM